MEGWKGCVIRKHKAIPKVICAICEDLKDVHEKIYLGWMVPAVFNPNWYIIYPKYFEKDIMQQMVQVATDRIANMEILYNVSLEN